MKKTILFFSLSLFVFSNDCSCFGHWVDLPLKSTLLNASRAPDYCENGFTVTTNSGCDKDIYYHHQTRCVVGTGAAGYPQALIYMDKNNQQCVSDEDDNSTDPTPPEDDNSTDPTPPEDDNSTDPSPDCEFPNTVNAENICVDPDGNPVPPSDDTPPGDTPPGEGGCNDPDVSFPPKDLELYDYSDVYIKKDYPNVVLMCSDVGGDLELKRLNCLEEIRCRKLKDKDDEEDEEVEEKKKPDCNGDSIYDISSEKCICNSGFEPSGMKINGQDVCLEKKVECAFNGGYRLNGVCHCDSPAVLKIINGQNFCIDEDIEDTCESINPNMHQAGSGSGCICNDGFREINIAGSRDCIPYDKCPLNSVRINDGCVCNVGYTMGTNNICVPMSTIPNNDNSLDVNTTNPDNPNPISSDTDNSSIDVSGIENRLDILNNTQSTSKDLLASIDNTLNSGIPTLSNDITGLAVMNTNNSNSVKGAVTDGSLAIIDKLEELFGDDDNNSEDKEQNGTVTLEYTEKETNDILQGYEEGVSNKLNDFLGDYTTDFTTLYQVVIPVAPSCGCQDIHVDIKGVQGTVKICDTLDSLFLYMRPLLWFFFLVGILFDFLRGTP